MLEKASDCLMGRYVTVIKPAVSQLNWTAEHGKGKWKYSKDIFIKSVKELEIA